MYASGFSGPSYFVLSFRLFVSFDYSGEQVFYAYYINKTDTGNNFNITNSYASGATFSDTVTTIYGG